ncbi:MAG: universal stress protein, partial [Deinococcales bacterium]|nr:universal stress protein [Chitinophagaceae bacterium]
LVILLYGDEKVDDLLVFSQVVLSLQLGFAIIPLIHFVSDKRAMGEFAIKNYTKTLSWLVAGILVFLNVKLIADEILDFFNKQGLWGWKLLIILAVLAFIWLFLMMTFLPIVQKRRHLRNIALHREALPLKNLIIAQKQHIAVALDFSNIDEKLIAHALAQGKSEATYTLLHIVESVSASYLGAASDDTETRKDRERLQAYAQQLSSLGYTVNCELGYRNRVKEIVRLVKVANADMLVMGAHRHSGLKDYLFGETIESVRHQLKIPVLIVNT